MADVTPWATIAGPGAAGTLPTKFGGAGVLQVGDGTPTTNADGLRFGADPVAEFFRSSPGVISTNAGFVAGGPYVYLAGGAIIYLSADTLQQIQSTGPGLVGLTGADLRLVTLGKGLRVAEGANGKQGVATLVAGTVTVANTSITANSRILLSPQDAATTGRVTVSARVVGTSFTITSSVAGDTGVVAFQIFEPA